MERTLRAGEIPLTVVQCVHAAECAGCPLIHLDYAQQLTQKRARVVMAMAHYPGLELLYTRPVTPADPMVGYRGRAKLIVSPDGRIGLYARTGNHDVVDIPDCRVLTPSLAELVATLRGLVAAPPPGTSGLLLPFNPLGGGTLRALDLREVRLATPRPLPTVPEERGAEAANDAHGEAWPQTSSRVPSTHPAPSSRSASQHARRPCLLYTSPSPRD